MTKTHSNRKAESGQHGAPHPAQPDSNEQSGSAGRQTSPEHLDPHKNAGQDKYGQTGAGGAGAPETDGQASYRRSDDKNAPTKEESNEGSGRAEHESDEIHRGGKRGAVKTPP